ncbi:MAG TPA: tRNA (N6-isopentenyl adenosine(37)-C2)-methylthiotransferase MiaB [Azospirillum sp.]|nr:tRNA (N6-isopentenyl adenosine(37)-C2)-methylthiotransferase MiaB [Azospirillum sp.]
MGKKLFIKTWGCQMNVYDSARMADVLAPLGYRTADEPDGADMVILNTCHIREKAAEKVFSELGRLRTLKDRKADQGERMILAVAGCVAQAEGEEIVARAPYVDIVFGPQTYHTLPEMVARAHRAAGAVLNTDFPAESKFDHLPDDAASQGVTAFLAVQEGCDKFCTFCVVPYTRGAEFSRPAAQVIEEAKRLVAGGTREINLLGQNVNAFHGEAPDGSTWGLARLIRELAEIDGLERIRYTTSHPRDLDDELIRVHAEVPQLMPYLHLPVQAGSDRILAAMNRKHTADHYRALVDKLRAARPDLALSGDFIVGFPGERDADFAETLRLVNDVRYAQAYSFKYSPRPGTPAAVDDQQVPEEVKAERLAALQQLLDSHQQAFNQGFVGKTVPVLFDRAGKRPGQLLGRSPYMQSVYVEGGERLMGTIADVHVEAAHVNSLGGTIVTGVYESNSAGATARPAIPSMEARA